MSENESNTSLPPEGEESKSDNHAAIASQQTVPVERSSGPNVLDYMMERLSEIEVSYAKIAAKELEMKQKMLEMAQIIANQSAEIEKTKRDNVEKCVMSGRELQNQREVNKEMEKQNVSLKKKLQEQNSAQVKMQKELLKVKEELAMAKAKSVGGRTGKSKLCDAKASPSKIVDDTAGLKSQISGLTKALQKRDEAKLRMEREIAALKDELDKLKSGRAQTNEKGIQTIPSKPKCGKACQTSAVGTDRDGTDRVGTDCETSKNEQAIKIGEIAELKVALASSEEKLRKVMKEIGLKDEVITAKEKVVSGQERGVNALKLKLSEKTNLIRKQEKELSEMKKELAVKEEVIGGQVNEIASFKNQLCSLDGLLATTSNELVSKDEIIQHKSDELSILTAKLIDMEQLMKKKDNEMAINAEFRCTMESAVNTLINESNVFKDAFLSEQNKSITLKQTSEAFMSALLAEQNKTIHHQATLRGLDQLLATSEKVVISDEDLIRNQRETITKLEKQTESLLEESNKTKTYFRKTTQTLVAQVHKLRNERDLLKDSYELSLTDKMRYAIDYESKISKLKTLIDETERNARNRENQFRFRINSITQVVEDGLKKTEQKMQGCKSPVRYHYLKKRNEFCEKLHNSIFIPSRMC